MTDVQAALETARARIRAGRIHDAVGVLDRALTTAPDSTEVLRLVAQVRRETRNPAGAEAALKRLLELQPADVQAWIELGDAQAVLGRPAEAEQSFRKAHGLDAAGGHGARALAQHLQAQGRSAEVLEITGPLWETTTLTPLIALHGAALKALGRQAEAVAADRRTVELEPTNPIAEHNLGAVLANLGRFEEASATTTRALAKGARAPETWLVHGHALQGLDRLDEAEAAYRQAIRLRPTYADAHRDLAQLVWMRTEDKAAATAEVRRVMAETSNPTPLALIRAKVLSEAGDVAGAYEILSTLAGIRPAEIGLTLAASQEAIRAGQGAQGLAYARRAASMLPDDARVLTNLCEAELANGLPAEAAATAEKLRAAKAEDQHALALQLTAWRLLGDPRYGLPCDYAEVVRAYKIAAPEGWASLDAYLADLAEGLAALHVTRTHPVGQSLRHGSQTNQSLRNAAHPAIRAFPEAIDGAIRAHMAHLGQGSDPLRARNTGAYEIAGLWSVRLRPGGFHIDHVHPEGWLSSACYIALPGAVETDRQGWIRFGQPGIATEPPLQAEHFVKPEPGMLVLFPSYLWHGTVPFEGDESRLTVAFDLVPA